ncbi:hypothetical protein BDV95DRAFT_489965 [Massariosphaeria phaeospora]|uniref:DUF3533 domain-containing protein n=1 Tax=Massariosphaeria phaeospora TaxID=100035 RepID=A0A7C8II33_9PLEO|nr:hypothetical protein BDV95DRAFT_489965 [Massariosphaeria phaeospora]
MLRQALHRPLRPFRSNHDADTEETGTNSNNTDHTVENGKSHEEGEKTPVGFWDPSLKHVRKRAISKWIVTTLVLMTFILGVLSIYWGVFFRVETRLKHLLVYVVDFDGVAPYDTGNPPLVGPAIVQLTEKMVQSGQPTLGFGTRLPSEFNNDPLQVRQAVYDWDAWAAIIINPNATAMLYSAIATGNASYDPLGACQLVYQDARDDTNWSNFMSPIISMLMTEAQSTVGTLWAQNILQNASNPTTLANIQAVPQALNPAIGFSHFNLRPMYPYTTLPAVSIGLIYLIIISFFSFSFYMPIHMQYLNPKDHPPLKFHQLIIWRWCTTVLAYIFLSLAYSLISLAFQVNFSHMNPVASETQVTNMAYDNPIAYGRGTFLVYWALNFWGMVALGLACENVAMVVGQPWMGMWLIFWVITNVSTSFYDIEIAPGFYHWGYAWPLHSVVEASRQILFDLHSRIGLDFGILIAWGAVNTTLFPICCWFQRWKTQRNVHEYWPMD